MSFGGCNFNAVEFYDLVRKLFLGSYVYFRNISRYLHKIYLDIFSLIKMV